MRVAAFPVNTTDAIHIYSDSQHIWLQLRRHFPTQDGIGTPSFKVAANLTPAQAIAIAAELLVASQHYQGAPPPINPPAQSDGTAINHGKPWTPDEDKRLADAYDAGTPVPQLARTHQRGVGGIQSRLAKLGKLAPDQFWTYPPES